MPGQPGRDAFFNLLGEQKAAAQRGSCVCLGLEDAGYVGGLIPYGLHALPRFEDQFPAVPQTNRDSPQSGVGHFETRPGRSNLEARQRRPVKLASRRRRQAAPSPSGVVRGGLSTSFASGSTAVSTATIEQPSSGKLPRRVRGNALVRPVKSEVDLERPLIGRTSARAVGRAKVYYTAHPSLDLLRAVLDGLRRL